jgi:uncharacterized protein
VNIQPDRQAIAAFCRRHHIRRMAFFGSVLRDDFGPQSDVDVLVEFEPAHVPGWGIVTMADELSALLGGRRVDLLTFKGLHWRIRERVLREAQEVYAA